MYGYLYIQSSYVFILGHSFALLEPILYVIINHIEPASVIIHQVFFASFSLLQPVENGLSQLVDLSHEFLIIWNCFNTSIEQEIMMMNGKSQGIILCVFISAKVKDTRQIRAPLL